MSETQNYNGIMFAVVFRGDVFSCFLGGFTPKIRLFGYLPGCLNPV